VAIKWNLLSRNAAAVVPIPTTRKRKPQVFDQTQGGTFLEAIYGDRLEALFWAGFVY
jgi:hypothetical protein